MGQVEVTDTDPSCLETGWKLPVARINKTSMVVESSFGAVRVTLEKDPKRSKRTPSGQFPSFTEGEETPVPLLAWITATGPDSASVKLSPGRTHAGKVVMVTSDMNPPITRPLQKARSVDAQFPRSVVLSHCT